MPRWEEEIDSGGIRSTLCFGVFAKLAHLVEQVITACALVLLEEAGDAGRAAVAAAARGKPIAAMTLGQQVDLIRRLAPNRLRKQDLQLLQRLTVLRNKYAHGRIPENQVASTREFMTSADRLCHSHLVESLISGG
jgi:hypothetical protein